MSTLRVERATIDLFEMMSSPNLFETLRQRMGWDDSYLSAINDPSHDILQHIDELCSTLDSLRISKAQLVVMPDFDMDGVTSGVLAWAGLNELGINAELYVPDHRRGHDITVEAADDLLQQFPHTRAVLTTDSGINSHAGIQRIRDHGVLALVTDHHMELEPGSNADIAVNPARLTETYSHPGICGAMVAWQVLDHYAQLYDRSRRSSIRALRLFAGIGTVSDVMPLLYENRQVVKDSVSLARLLYRNIPSADRATEYDIGETVLIQLLNGQDHAPQYLSAFEGFALVLRQFREHRKIRSIADISEGFYGFYLAPAFNAIRRVDGDMTHAFGAFTADTAEEKIEHIDTVIELNERRKKLVEIHLDDIDSRDQPLAPYCYLTDAGPGMLGLLASALMHRSGMPTIVVNDSDDPQASRGGSARAPQWFPVISTMTEAGFTAVGHEQACGVRMADQAELEAFVDHLSTRSAEIHQQITQDGTLLADSSGDLVLGGTADADAGYDNVSALLSLTQSIDKLRPFGQGFPEPVIEMVLDLSQCSISTIGEEETHIRIVLPSGMKLLWWNAAEQHLDQLKDSAESPLPGESVIRVLVKLSLNQFMGEESVQAVITDLKAEELTEPLA